MAKERNNYEMPTNEEFEDLLQGNLETIKPLDMKEKEVAGQKQIFPFWNAVEPEAVHYSKESYLNAKQKKQRSMNSDKNLVQKMEDIIGKMNNTHMVDMTDAVKPPKNELNSTATNKQMTEWDSTNSSETEVKSNAASAKSDNVGAVKVPKNDLSASKGDKQMTEWDSTSSADTEVKSNAASPKGDNVGAVKVPTNDLSASKGDKQMTEWDSTEAPKSTSNAASPKSDNVGAVKPKEADMGSTKTTKQVTNWDSTNMSEDGTTYGGIDFSKFM